MMLKILLPSGAFIEKKDISRIVAESTNGSFGLLPQRLDCVAAIVPGVLVYESQLEGEKFVAIDEGVLIKTGFSVVISVREAIEGKSLEQLREAVEDEFLNMNEQEQYVRQAMVKMESSFINHLVEMRHE
jgi:F-type H+-transporting ATPase subunit epsilon